MTDTVLRVNSKKVTSKEEMVKKRRKETQSHPIWTIQSIEVD